MAAKVISWIDQYRGEDFQNPAKIDETVKRTGLKPFGRFWKDVREVVEKIYAQQGPLSKNLQRSKLAIDSFIIAFFGLWVVAVIFSVESLQTLLFNQLSLITVLALVTLYTVFRATTMRKIKENSNAFSQDSKIRSAVQNMIYYLCERLRLEKEDPKKCLMQLHYPDYYGITNVGKAGALGRKHYSAIPSVFDAVVSKAEKYIKAVECWAEERQAFESLLRVSPKVKIQVLIPDKLVGDKIFQSTCKKVIGRIPGKILVQACDLGDLNDRIVITKNKVWRTKGREWHTLVEVEEPDKRRGLEKSFDEKWSNAHVVV